MMTHIPVLLNETIEGLNLQAGQIAVDATFGRGGHSKVIAEKIGPSGTLIGLDADAQNIADAESLVKSFPCQTTLRTANFRDLEKELDSLGVEKGGVNGFLFDLGLNSLQLESSGRGFSFQVDEPLIMTLGKDHDGLPITAEIIINEWSQNSIESVIRGFGGELFSGRIARAIAEARRKKRIHTTFELVEIIRKAVPVFYTKRRIHFATKTFQALRIAVNDEFGSLKVAVGSAWDYLGQGGRLAVISFHDGEDRIVKKMFADLKKKGGKVITKKVIAPSRKEIADNPRSRSAKMRIIEKA